MKYYGYHQRWNTFELLEAEIITGDVFWNDKAGGNMAGRSCCGVHESKEAAALAFQKVMVDELHGNLDRAKAIQVKLSALLNAKLL